MHFVPNGQNIQFIIPEKLLPSPSPPVNEGEEPLVAMEKPSWAKAMPQRLNKSPELKSLPKDIAPHLNRAQRKAKLAELKKQAKDRAAEAAKKQIALEKKLNKEKTDG